METNNAYRREALQAVNEFWKERYRPPTHREIRDLTSMTSTCTVSRALADLQEQGLIVISGGKGKSRTPVPLWVKKAIQDAAEAR